MPKKTENVRLFYNETDLEESRTIPAFYSNLNIRSIKQFLQAVERVAPHVIKELEAVSSYYSPDMEPFFDDYVYRDAPSLWSVLTGNIKHKKLLEFKRKLCRWAKKWNLTDPDCKNAVYIEMALFWIIKVRHNIQNPDNMTLSECVPDEEDWFPRSDFFNREYPFVFAPPSPWPTAIPYNLFDVVTVESNSERNILNECEELDMRRRLSPNMQEKRGLTYPWVGQGWNPLKENWEDFYARIDKLFKEYTEVYRKRTEAIFESRGYPDGVPKQAEYHFDWLAEYQFNTQLSFHDIAVKHKLPLSKNPNVRDERYKTVENGVHSAAKLALIDVRPSCESGRRSEL